MSARAAVKPLAGLELGGEPRVNLLPPEVGERVRIRRTRAVMVFLVIVAIALVGVGYGFATVRSFAAQASLLSAQQRTAILQQQREEFAEVLAVTNSTRLLEDTMAQAATTDLVWADVFDAIAPLMDTSRTVVWEWNGLAPSPWSTQLDPSGDLREPRVATLSIGIVSVSPLDTTALYRRIAELDFIADLSIDQVVLDENEFGFYLTSITLNLNEEARTDKWVVDEEQDSESAAEEQADAEQEGETDEG